MAAMAAMAPILPRLARKPQAQAPACKASPRAAAAATPDGVHRNNAAPEKLEPFSRSRISRLLREPSLLEKAEHALAERCTQLEGDEAYRCWEALFEFENIKEAYEVECDTAASGDRPTACRPLERFENLVRQSGGVSGLIDNVRMVAKTAKMHEKAAEVPASAAAPARPTFPEDRGLPAADEGAPKADEVGLLPESDLTRMLRHKGRSPAWFTHPPDHESD